MRLPLYRAFFIIYYLGALVRASNEDGKLNLDYADHPEHMNGVLGFEFSEDNAISLDVTDWRGSPFQVDRLPDVSIILLSTLRDVIMIYSHDDASNGMFVLLRESREKYFCETGILMESYVAVTQQNDRFMVLDVTACHSCPTWEIDLETLQCAIQATQTS